MAVTWRRASETELEMLVALRLTVLRAANLLPEDTPLPAVEQATRAYYAQALRDDTCVIYLAEEDGQVVGTGGVCFYQVMPICDDPTGKKAFIMSMYTAPSHRRRGIGAKTLSLLVEEAKRRGVTSISLEATKMGRPLYERFGFVQAQSEMYLPQ